MTGDGAVRKRGFLERRWRVLLGLTVWIAGGLAAHAVGLKPGAASLIGWNLACVAYLVPTFWTIVKADGETVKRTACEEDEQRSVMMTLVLVAVASSFASVIVALREAKGSHGGSDWLAVMAISTIVLSWFVVQSIFTLHYAHKYFGDGDDDGEMDRGIKFTGDPPETYRDFWYVAVCMGATFQVSDFSLTKTSFRNLATAHALVAFGFNTLVLALGVNIVSNLLGQ